METKITGWVSKDPEVEKRRLKWWWKIFRECNRDCKEFFTAPMEFEESLGDRAKGEIKKEVGNVEANGNNGN